VPTLLFHQRVVDTRAQAVRDVILATVGDDLSQLDFEVKGIETWGAVVEVTLDLGTTLVGEFAVEIVIEPLDRLVAVDVGVFRPHLASSHPGLPAL
jgi:hypothetical protein